ncbi:MAG TPA: sulfatase-like hydrolase/transferase [Vicinamibacterales bacterium]|nr:sulfatase-like hydrolase/transferase [Vicinamibacterales bacterium]
MVAVLTVLCCACRAGSSGPSAVASGTLRGFNVLLVTIDTLRADHVGVYGSTLGLTPTLDRLAGEGLRFDVAHAHVPMTLPSHTTIMTGLYPAATGVRDNGSFRFDGTKPTLAGALQHAGYRTAAFVGAFVLDARFGLNTGFDLYDDRVQGASANLEIVQRTADAVLEPAAAWVLNSNPEPRTQNREPRTGNPEPRTPNSEPRPWFAWVHLYDPHEPYTPPEPFASRYRQDPYSGEIAYTDAALGRLLDRLRGGALDRTLIVVTSDHGESLGEHGERTHGLFAYEATLRVPLIVWAPGPIRPAVVSAPARLVDLAPTILDLVGVAPPSFDGRSLRPRAPGEPPLDDPGSYFEALNANLTRNWAPLKGIVRDRLKLVDLPIPELYDLEADPSEQRNLYASQRERARDLESRLDRISAGAQAPSAPAPVDSDAAMRLRSLGYVVSTAPTPARAFTAADDPKRLVHLNAMLDDAAAALGRSDPVAAVATLQAAIRERPDLTIAYDRLAFALRAAGRTSDAVAVLDRAAREGHADRALLRSLGSGLRDLGDTARAIAVLEPLAREDAADLQTLDALGQTYARAGRPRDAEAAFERVLAASPNASATWNNLGSLYLSENRTADALAALEKAVAINPELAGAHNGLGVVYARRGELDKAAEEWKKALALRPDFADARANLERIAARGAIKN